MCIILLNLLISIISQFYDEANSDMNIIRYELKCQFNYEASMIRTFVNSFWGCEQALVFHLQADISDECLSDSYQGIVKPLKYYITENIKKMEKKVMKKLEDKDADSNTI